MASKSVAIILSLKNRFSKGFQDFKDEAQNATKETKRLQNQVRNFGNSAKKALGGAAKTAALAGAATAGMGLKTGLAEAMDLEGFRMQLNTATKDTQKAGEIMKYAIEMANKTPFEGAELVEGAAKFEAMGMSAKKWLTLTGDMSAATNKSFDQATEALIDAQTGELERLKEFGITKAMIQKRAEEKFRDTVVVNNKGQIEDMEKFNEALVDLMQEKYTGGMEAQAKTLKGTWSTVTGVTKSALSTMVGMTADGTVRAGSLLDNLKNRVSGVAERFDQWQADGTIDKLAAKADRGFGVIISLLEGAGKAASFAAEVFKFFKPQITGLVAAFAAMKIMNGAISGFKLLRAAILMVNVGLKASPLFIIASVIYLIVSALTALGVNWGDVFKGIFNWIGNVWGKLKGFYGYLVNMAVPGWLRVTVDLLITAVNKLREFQQARDNGGGGKTSFDGGGGSSGSSGGGTRGHATGTPYFRGGRTRVDEGNRGEIKVFPSGTAIIPNDLSKRLLAGNTGQSIVVNLNIAGNMIGNREYADWLVQYMARGIKTAIANT